MSSDLYTWTRRPGPPTGGETVEARTPSSREARHIVGLLIWTLAWVATLALAVFGQRLWGSAPALGWIAIAVNLVAGAGWIVTQVRYLRGVGELQRKVQLEAMGLALGVGVVGSCALSAANTLDLIALEATAAGFAIISSIVYAVATLVGNLRYR